jgi:hypothetical protein
MTTSPSPTEPPSTHRYRTVVEGVELANEFMRSRMTVTEFSRQRGVTVRMVTYWTKRARLLAAATSADLVQVAEIGEGGAIEPLAGKVAVTGTAVIQASSPAVSSASPMIEVRLPSGVRIGVAAGFSPTVLAQVVACLGGPSC